ncbi:MAG TPA: Trm112 family protein [Pyrinomonadaceae bacterium]|nr:Trm112 family protein [Pyrinomonadaceae bacterium]
MALSPELLEILRCPKCKSEVELKPDNSGLKCTAPECALVYPIRDDIPVMLIDEASTEK